MEIPQPGEIYRHYKYNPDGEENNYTYRIVAIGYDTEVDNEVVIYEPLYDSEHLNDFSATVYVRPLEMFVGEVDVEGESRGRFVKLEEVQQMF